MSVTTYEIGCKYLHPKLKNKVYFLSKSFFNPSTNEVTVSIDSGDASVSIETHVPHPTTPNVIEGFGIKFTETESLDERYKFTKQLNISINGHLTDTTWLLENDYYIMVETIEGTFYLINVDFPSKMSFTYNLSNSQDQTDFVFTSNSNFPALKVNSVPWESFNTCKTYHVPGVDYLKLLEKDYATIDKENGVVNLFNSQTFKNIDYLKNTISLQETYDGDIATTTISFEIPFGHYNPSWQYNLLEFKQNLYVAQVENINGNTIFAGFEHGLEPQYEINGSTSESESTSIKITLTEASSWGIFEYDSWSYYNVPEKKWVGVQSEYICLAFGVAGYTLMQEVDENGTPTGRYKCLAGEESRYSDYNIIDTYSEPESFPSPQCSRSMARGNNVVEYTCIDGDKYEVIAETVSYDNGKTYTQTEFHLGPLVETGSTWCLPPAEYKWVLDETQYTCATGETLERWVESGYTCDKYDAHTTYYKQLSYDNGETWVDTDPLETKEIVTECSDNCMSPYAKQYLTFEALEDCNFSLNIGSLIHHNISDFSLSYSTDGGDTWSELLYSTATVPSGGTVIFAGYWPSSWEDYVTFNSTGRFNAYGNINSLVYGHDFVCTYADNASLPYLFVNTDIVSAENLIFPESNVGLVMAHYQGMFEGCTSLITPPTVLPATRFRFERPYASMFAGCTSLTSAPELPATLGNTYRCYTSMFAGCTSLTTAPALPSLVVNDEDYMGMFAGCTSLTTAPELPATTIGSNGYTGGDCYRSMFAGCTSLTSVPVLPATTPKGDCYRSMFAGCTSLTTVPLNMLPATTLKHQCYGGGDCYAGDAYAYMFAGCTSLTVAPELPATTLAHGCYFGMFSGCTSLTTAPELPATNLSGASSAYTSMFEGCTSLTTAPSLSATNLSDSVSACTCMFSECTSLLTAPELLSTTLGTYCYAGMFQGCISLTTVPSNMLPATALEINCYDNMFRDCISLTTAPDLLATYINRSYCYRSMFAGCTSLNRIVCLGDYTTYVSTDSHATQNWTNGVSSNGTFIKSSSSGQWPYGNDGIPSGWRIFNYEPAIYDWVVSGYTCDGYDKYERLVKVVSYDYAKTWEVVIPEEYDRGRLIESSSVDCGYDPTRTSYKLTLNDSTAISTPCTSPSVSITSGQVSTYSSSCVSAEIGECTTSLGKKCFYNFSNLTGISLSDSIIEIGDNTFERCVNLTAITIPDSVTDMGDYTFAGCYNLANIIIGSGVTSIGNQVFSSCRSLASIGPVGSGASVELPDTITQFDYGAFRNCTGITTVTIPNSITELGNSVFRGCSGLTSVTIGNSITKISYGLFTGCNNLTTIDIPNNIASIGDEAFSGCTALTTCVIGSGVTIIYNSAFHSCTSLSSFTINVTTPPSIGYYVFDSTPIASGSGYIYVPSASVDAYKSATRWSTYASRIQAIPGT